MLKSEIIKECSERNIVESFGPKMVTGEQKSLNQTMDDFMEKILYKILVSILFLGDVYKVHQYMPRIHKIKIDLLRFYQILVLGYRIGELKIYLSSLDGLVISL